MKKVLIISSVLLGMFFLSGCGKQPTSQVVPVMPAPVGQQSTTTQSTVETLNYCDKSFIAERVEVNGVDIVNRILQLLVAKDKNNCINFEQIKNIAVLKRIDGDTTNITLYEKNSLSDLDRQLTIDEQLNKIRSNGDYPQVNEYIIKADSIYPMDSMAISDASALLGKIK